MNQSVLFFDADLPPEPSAPKKAKPVRNPLLDVGMEEFKAAVADYLVPVIDCSIGEVLAGMGLPETIPAAKWMWIMQVLTDAWDGCFIGYMDNGKMRFRRRDDVPSNR